MSKQRHGIISRVIGWIGEQQDWLVWVPLSLALVLAAWAYLPLLDPRAGIDSLGDLQGYAILLFKGTLSCAMAWLCKRLYGKFKDDDEITTLEQDAADRESWQAVAILIIDRLEVFAWLAFWFFCFSG